MTRAQSPSQPAQAPLKLRIKHRLAVSPLAAPIEAVRHLIRRVRDISQPELALLRQEDRMIDLALPKLVQPDWNCLDVGGHLGSVSYKLRQLAPRGQLTIVEASPGKAAMLKHSFPDSQIHAVAVSDQEGEVSFFENLHQPGFSSLGNRDTHGATQEITVPARRLDDLIGEAHVDFIKIDVEGFEYPALRGGEALLRRCRPVILFEAGPVHDDALDTGLTEALFTMLTGKLDYDIYAAFDLHFERPALTEDQFRSYRQYPFQALNYFALPRGDAHSGSQT